MMHEIMKVNDEFVTIVLSLNETSRTLDILVRLNKEDNEYEMSFREAGAALAHYNFLRHLFNL